MFFNKTPSKTDIHHNPFKQTKGSLIIVILILTHHLVFAILMKFNYIYFIVLFGIAALLIGEAIKTDLELMKFKKIG